MDVSVIIVNYNTCKITQECIDSIYKYTFGVEFEIILVDNASIDGSKEHFEKEKKIRYVYNSDNYGFGKANNIGAKVSKGKYLFFLNSDTYFENNALQYYYEYAESHKNVGFIGSILQDVNGNPNGYGSSFPTKISELRKALHLPERNKNKLYEYNREPFEVDYVLGADMFVSSELYNRINGFDEDFFMYYEESDMQFRSSKLGYKNIIISGPAIVHLEGISLVSLIES